MKSFQWTDYLKLARVLADGTDEAEVRSSISRAYYAAYRVARDEAIARKLVKPTAVGHAEVWLAFTRGRSPSERLIGQLGMTLRAERNHADYDRPHPHGQRLGYAAQFAIGIAARLLGELETMRGVRT